MTNRRPIKFRRLRDIRISGSRLVLTSEETEGYRVFVDALRGFLDLPPLYNYAADDPNRSKRLAALRYAENPEPKRIAMRLRAERIRLGLHTPQKKTRQ